MAWIPPAQPFFLAHIISTGRKNTKIEKEITKSDNTHHEIEEETKNR